ncbi:hypothetical protein STEG23_029379, partial [Scotinomys teguina]
MALIVLTKILHNIGIYIVAWQPLELIIKETLRPYFNAKANKFEDLHVVCQVQRNEGFLTGIPMDKLTDMFGI